MYLRNKKQVEQKQFYFFVKVKKIVNKIMSSLLILIYLIIKLDYLNEIYINNIKYIFLIIEMHYKYYL